MVLQEDGAGLGSNSRGAGSRAQAADRKQDCRRPVRSHLTHQRSKPLSLTASRRRFVGDEMVCNGLPFKDFTALVTKIRAEVGPGIPYAPLLHYFHRVRSARTAQRLTVWVLVGCGRTSAAGRSPARPILGSGRTYHQSSTTSRTHPKLLLHATLRSISVAFGGPGTTATACQPTDG